MNISATDHTINSMIDYISGLIGVRLGKDPTENILRQIRSIFNRPVEEFTIKIDDMGCIVLIWKPQEFHRVYFTWVSQFALRINTSENYEGILFDDIPIDIKRRIREIETQLANKHLQIASKIFGRLAARRLIENITEEEE